MEAKRKKQRPRFIQIHGSVAIEQEEGFDLSIRDGDVNQSLRWYKKLLESQSVPAVPKDAETRDRLIWLPTEDRENLLRTWHKRKRDYEDYCVLRITVPIEDLEKMLQKEEEEKKRET
jgi:hypothetical protein